MSGVKSSNGKVEGFEHTEKIPNLPTRTQCTVHSAQYEFTSVIGMRPMLTTFLPDKTKRSARFVYYDFVRTLPCENST